MYVVQKRAGALPVYTICPVGQDGPTRTLHRDLLLPCGFLADEEEETEQSVQVSKPRARQNSPQSAEKPLDSDEEDCDYSWSYPPRFETETRILQPSTLILTVNVPQTRNESSFQTHSSPASGSLSGNSPDGVPDARHTDTLNSAVEEGNANLTQHSTDDPPVDTEFVERCSTETENISTETEPHTEQREENPVIASEPSLTGPSSQE